MAIFDSKLLVCQRVLLGGLEHQVYFSIEKKKHPKWLFFFQRGGSTTDQIRIWSTRCRCRGFAITVGIGSDSILRAPQLARQFQFKCFWRWSSAEIWTCPAILFFLGSAVIEPTLRNHLAWSFFMDLIVDLIMLDPQDHQKLQLSWGATSGGLFGGSSASPFGGSGEAQLGGNKNYHNSQHQFEGAWLRMLANSQ